jgi:hypothetical protein
MNQRFSTRRRTFLLGSAASILCLAVACIPAESNAAEPGSLTPEMFGARGDGVTNDTRAFQDLARAINMKGGGTIEFRAGATYIVGLQLPGRDGKHSFAGQPILDIENCSGPVDIRGNGAVMRFNRRLKFGLFDRAGKPVSYPLPYFAPGQKAAPTHEMGGMITIANCRGPVSISDVEFDGNARNLHLGGKFGDTGWQLPGDGLFIRNALGGLDVSGIYAHDMPRDGALFLNTEPTRGPIAFRNCRFLRNCRQGVSFIGGGGALFENCAFNDTGKGAFWSSPAAGFDAEAEAAPIRDLTFTGCQFINNTGVGMLADSGDSANMRWRNCSFVGTTSQAAWIKKPGLRFDQCRFVGTVTNFPVVRSPADAPVFTDCFFTDDPKQSPTGKIADTGIGIGNGGASVGGALFDRCKFDYGRTLKAMEIANARFRNCILNNGSLPTAALGCSWEGENVVKGTDPGFGARAGLRIRGRVIFNGTVLS